MKQGWALLLRGILIMSSRTPSLSGILCCGISWASGISSQGTLWMKYSSLVKQGWMVAVKLPLREWGHNLLGHQLFWYKGNVNHLAVTSINGTEFSTLVSDPSALQIIQPIGRGQLFDIVMLSILVVFNCNLFKLARGHQRLIVLLHLMAPYNRGYLQPLLWNWPFSLPVCICLWSAEKSKFSSYAPRRKITIEWQQYFSFTHVCIDIGFFSW